ncbi:MAG: glycosyltransferase family 4 protein [Cytophagaceae bacterium]|nr:glycosyltransferase family 4 protein [Cytophagaceae bacterium]
MSKSLKIVQLNNRVPFPLNDGGNIATYYLAQHMTKAGHEVHLLCLNTDKHFQDPAQVKGIRTVNAVPHATRITPWGLLGSLFSAFPYNVKRFYSPDFETELIALLERLQPDVVQVEGSYMGMYVPLIRAHSNALVVLRSHNIEHQIWSRLANAETHVLKRWYLQNLSPKIKAYEDRSMHNFDAILAITPEDARYYHVQGFTGPVLHVPAGATVPAVMPDVPRTKALGFIGSLEWLPNLQGVEWFVKNCWPALHAAFPDKVFYIAGKHTPATWWVRQESGVQVLGEVENAQEFMASCQLFLVPLLSGGGMRIKIVEAMALKTPVVSTLIGAEGIAAEDGKEILLASDAEQMKEKIRFGWQHPEEAAHIGLQGAEVARNKYDWNTITQHLLAFYQQRIDTKKTVKTNE